MRLIPVKVAAGRDLSGALNSRRMAVSVADLDFPAPIPPNRGPASALSQVTGAALRFSQILNCPIERFRAKWTPVRVKKTRQIKNLELRFDSIETEL
jgi:hypothetical protein